MKLYKPFYDAAITPATKKYSVMVKDENGNSHIIHFGDRNMQHYHDKIGHWSSLNHNDKKRRTAYLARARGIKNKKGEYTYLDKNSSNYWSVNMLW